MAITAFLSRSPGLLNRGPGGPAYLGAGSLYRILSPTDWTSFAPNYIIVQRPPSSGGRHKSISFNPSTVIVIPWYSSTGCTCYLHRCISYFDSLAGSEVNMQHLTFTEFMWNLFIEFLHLANFLEIIRYYYVVIHCQRHFSDTLTWVLFNKYFRIFVVNCGWTFSTLLIMKIHIPTTELLKPAPKSPITRGCIPPCSQLISAAVWEALWPRLNWFLRLPKECITSFSIDKIRENGFELTKKRSRRYPAKTITDADYADDIAILVNTPNQGETLLHSFERAAAGIGLHVNAHKTEYMCYNQTGDISTVDGTSLKLVDKFTYLGSSVSSAEKDIDTRLTKAWTAINRLSIIWKSDLTDKMKRSFFQAAVVSILLYGCTTWEETRRQLHKNAANNIEQVLAATPTIRPPASHHENYPS